jgi:hypothetical protein
METAVAKLMAVYADTHIESLDRVIRQEDHDGDLWPLDITSIRHAYDWLVSTLGLPAGVVKPPNLCDTDL